MSGADKNSPIVAYYWELYGEKRAVFTVKRYFC